MYFNFNDIKNRGNLVEQQKYVLIKMIFQFLPCLGFRAPIEDDLWSLIVSRLTEWFVSVGLVRMVTIVISH